jgi:hypothetical protein
LAGGMVVPDWFGDQKMVLRNFEFYVWGKSYYDVRNTGFLEWKFIQFAEYGIRNEI